MPVCPQCRAEYRPGFKRCADCDLPLDESAGPPPEPVPLKLRQVYSTSSLPEAEALRAALDAEGIESTLDNEFSWVAIGMPTPGVPFGISVAEGDAERALEVVREIRNGPPADFPSDVAPGPEPFAARRRPWLWLIGGALLLLGLNTNAGIVAAGAWLVILWGVLFELRGNAPLSGTRLLILFAVGCGSVAIAFALEFWLCKRLAENDVLLTFLNACAEELTKILAPFAFLFLVPAWGKDNRSWFMAAAAGGAGFGLCENLWSYAAQDEGAASMEASLGLFLVRGGSLLHLFESAWVGYAAVKHKDSFARFVVSLMARLVITTSLHGSWNLLAKSEGSLGLLIMFVGLTLIFIVWMRQIRHSMQEKSNTPLISADPSATPSSPLS